MDDLWMPAVVGASETGRLMLAVDWAATSLGPAETWPSALRTAVELCLNTRFPVLVVWGPELVKIYNDGYAAMIGTKHPAALGSPARAVWPEIWDVVGPMFHRVLSTGEATWVQDQRLDIERNGFLEECYFTYSYSPILDGDDVGGVLDIAMEATSAVVAERRLAFVSDLAAALVDSEDPDQVRARARASLGGRTPDVESATLEPDPLAIDGHIEVLDDGWCAGRPAHAVSAGLAGPTQRHRLVIRLSPHRPFDSGYRTFVHLAASTIGAALEAARHRRRELDEEREISRRLQGAMLLPASDLPTVATRYRPAAHRLSVGGDWYDVIDRPDGSQALVVGDCVGHGLEAAIAMGQLRSACRALVLDGAGPAEALAALDAFAATIPASYMTTVACLNADTRAGTLTYSLAGHPPPLLAGSGGTQWLDGARGVPLDVLPQPRPEETKPIAPGDTVVLYTDGLVERRGENIDAGMARLAAVASKLAGRPVHDIADALLDLDGSPPVDDVALLVWRAPEPT